MENPKLKEMLYNIHNLLDDVIDNGKYDRGYEVAL